MTKQDLNLMGVQVKKEIDSVKTTEDLNLINKKYLDKDGVISKIFQSLSKLPEKEKKEIAKVANEIKEWIKLDIDKKNRNIMDTEIREIEKKEWIDISLPGIEPKKGHLHPLTESLNKCTEIFEKMGFSIVTGPELEQEFFNFDLLNFPFMLIKRQGEG